MSESQLLADFQKFDEDFENTVAYLDQFKILDELQKLIKDSKNKLHDLFIFGLKYGVLSIVRYLYEVRNITYDDNLLHNYTFTFESEGKAASGMSAQLETNSSGNSKLTCSIDDKFSAQRKECIRYLVNMRKYSSYTSKNKKFFYTLNKAKFLQYNK